MTSPRPNAEYLVPAKGLARWFGDAVRPWYVWPGIWGLAALGLGAAAFLVWTVSARAGVAGGLGAAAVSVLCLAAWLDGRARAFDPLATLLRAAAEDDSEGRLITDSEGRILYANAAFGRLFPGAATLDDMAARLGGDDRAGRDFARLCGGAAAGVATEAEVPVQGGSGARAWRRIRVRPLPGRWRLALWRAEDITARRAEDAVRHSEEAALADLVEHMPAGFFSADAEGRILQANATLCAWLGVAPGDLEDGTVRFADFVVACEAHDTVAVADAPAMHGEVTLKSADGTVFSAALLQSQRLDARGELLYTRSMVVREVVWRAGGDTTAYSLSRLRWLFDEAPVGIALLDAKGLVADGNRAFLKLLGLHREAVVGRPLIERIAKEDRGDVGAQLSKVVMGTMRAAHLEVRMPAATGREITAALFASRMEDPVGEVSGVVIHFIDTTEQKTLEAQFSQAQKIHAIGQLAGGIAHDFNNLLTAMIGFCDLLLSRHGPDDPSFADIMQIKQNANRAANLVRQLLAFSRKQTLQPIDLDVTAALSDLSNLMRRLIGETIELRMEHGRDLGLVRVDPVQFDQVVINLVVNARDAMPGGGALIIRTSSVTLDQPLERGLEVMPPGEYVLIEVADTGVGIAKEHIDQIFEPFYSTKEKGAGTGLGLSTVYGIVRQTEGFIFADSAPGEGASFSIYLPRLGQPSLFETPPTIEVAPPDAPGEPDLTGRGTVLLVEDEDAVRLFGARALRNKGYHVLEADSGEAALDVINGAGETIDLIISDVVMPGMDGHTFVRLVRQELPEVKVILVSGYAEETVAGGIERDPTIHFLPKPFSLKELAGKTKEVMGG